MLFGAAVPTFLLMYEDGRVIELSVFALGREVRGNGHWILGGGCSGIIKHSL